MYACLARLVSRIASADCFSLFPVSTFAFTFNLYRYTAELSVQFSTPKLRFAKLDLGRWPETAKVFNINLVGLEYHSSPRYFAVKH
jgi:hypothetical protein